jgi:site-specific recombinase XerD
MNSINKLKNEFLEYLEIEKGRSLKTVENYDRYLRLFLEFSHAKNTQDVSDETVRQYRLWLNRRVAENGQPLKKITQNYYLIALRSFLKYLGRRGIPCLAPERIELAKVGGRELELISSGELDRLLNSPTGNDEKVLRDKAILELLFSTGLRVSELCNLDRDSINLSRDEFTVRGKGEKVRLVFLSDRAREAIKVYLTKRDSVGQKVNQVADTSDALFVGLSNRGRSDRLTPRSVERMVKYYTIKSGISKKVTPHTIRHGFATDLLQNGADIRSVQIMLGHANVSTTQIYTHITDKQLRDIHKNFHDKKRS